MDISLLSKMIGELILDNDQVGIPGLGTFVAELVPATFSDRGYTINPPYRRLVFHPNCLEETLLADLYARANNQPLDVSKAYIKGFVTELKKVLMDRKAVTFPGLGRLRLTRGNQIFFIPNEDLDIFPDGTGLEPVSLKTHVETEEEVRIEVSRLAENFTAPIEEQPVPTQPEQPAPEPEPVQEQEPAPAPKKMPALLKTFIVLLVLAVLAFAAFMILARVAPETLDRILYSPEELKIIYY